MLKLAGRGQDQYGHRGKHISVEPGRGKFTDQAAEARPSVWYRIAGWIREETLHSLRRPTRLGEAIVSGQLVLCPITTPVDTLQTRSAVHWQDWMSSSLSSFHSRLWTIDYRKPDYQRRLESHTLTVPEVQQLVRKESVFHFSRDITGIRGISASKSIDHGTRDIDEFPLLRCHELAEPVTEEHLQESMRHWELRPDRVLFAEYPWAERRLYWLSDSDSHHFGVTRYQARCLGIAIPLTDRPCRYGVNMSMISAIRQQWHLSAAPTDELSSSLFDAMNVFECPFDNSGLPRHMYDTDKPGTVLKLVQLERGRPRASVITNVLPAVGFPDFGEQLQ